MTKSKKTKRALLGSVLALVLCFVMLLGTTFAWFTDTASTGVNTIQAGNLDIGLYWTDSLSAEKTDDGDEAIVWNNAEDGEAIFNYDKWEPGYTDIKYIKIVNNGNLAFQWKMNIVPLGDVGILADVIDVYCFEKPTSAITRDAIDKADSVGTLSDVIEAEDIKVQGVLLPSGTTDSKYISGEIVVAVALKMQETAGNEYQGKSVGENGFTIQLLATQYTYENDSVSDQYDAYAEYAITVSDITAFKIAVDSVSDGDNVVLAEDVTVGKDQQLVFDDVDDVTLDLGGSTISTASDFWYANPNDAANARLSPICVMGGSLTIAGMGKIDPGNGNAYAVDVHNGAEVTIENGTFVGNVETIYVQSGTVYIKGGTFNMNQTRNGSYEYMLHCSSSSYANGAAKIVVTGGSFYKFNPADNKSQGSNTNFVAEGYKVVQDGDWYTVVPDTNS